METKEGENKLLKITKQRNRQSKNVEQVRVIKSKTGEMLMEEKKVKQRWEEYLDNLLNQKNARERRKMRTEERERDEEDISGEEVRTGLRKMKKGKAQGHDDIPVEGWISLGNKCVEFLVNFFITLLRGRRCQMNGGGACSYQKQRMHQRMWKLPGDQVDEPLYETGERVIKARIRKEVTIAEQQFGFMPGRSITDAIYCLRMLLEKWTEEQKAVHCDFIGLEKAYD